MAKEKTRTYRKRQWQSTIEIILQYLLWLQQATETHDNSHYLILKFTITMIKLFMCNRRRSHYLITGAYHFSSEHAKYYWRTKLSFLCYLLHNWWYIYFYHTGSWNNFNI